MKADAPPPPSRSARRLAGEPSLYLRRHADDPVDWFPWGDEALAVAAASGRPLFLSIGYSSCHWCHVMARESFADPVIGAVLAENFVAVKIDREEHPDVDAQYMAALLQLAGHGGWPLSVFALPDGRPFFAGTYFPPTPRWGQPAFADLLRHVAGLWQTRRDDLERDAERLAAAVQRNSRLPVVQAPRAEGFAEAVAASLTDLDETHGGFVGAPKFPPHETLLLWQHAVRRGVTPESAAAAVAQTLDALIWRGLRDQIGGSFHRYCVDEAWQVPHFEQMLYDNAALLQVLADAVLDRVDDVDLRSALTDLAESLLRDWTTGGGWFAAAFDADDAGGEGACYTWTPAELLQALGPRDGDWACRWFRVGPRGPLEGRSTLFPAAAPGRTPLASGLGSPVEIRARLAELRPRLAAVRAARPQPARDDKGVLAWNGLLLAAMAAARRALGPAIEARMRGPVTVLTGWAASAADLPRAWYESERRGRAGLEDVAALGLGLWRWGLAADDPDCLTAAMALATAMMANIDADGRPRIGAGASPLGAPADWWDGPTPGGAALALEWLDELADVDGSPEFVAAREALAVALVPAMRARPAAARRLWRLADRRVAGVASVVLSEAAADWYDAAAPSAGADMVWIRPRAARWLVDRGAAMLEGRAAGAGSSAATAWLCRGRICERPLESLPALQAALAARGGPLG